MRPAPKPKKKVQRKRFAHRRSPEYAAYIRSLPCILNGRWLVVEDISAPGAIMVARASPHHCVSLIQVCHVKSRGAGGSDLGNIVPMCGTAHDQQHAWGIRTFEKEWSISLKAAAEFLYAAYLATREP